MKYFILIALLFLTSCQSEKQSLINLKKQQYYPSQAEKLVDSILYATAKLILQKHHDLYFCGDGASMPGGPIRRLSLMFETKRQKSKEELRILLIDIAHEIVNAVNQNAEIQQFLYERPFTIKNVGTTIHNRTYQGYPIHDGHGIAVAEFARGTLVYSIADPLNNFRLTDEPDESYEEAMKILQNG